MKFISDVYHIQNTTSISKKKKIGACVFFPKFFGGKIHQI